MVRAGCVFVVGILPFRTLLPGSFESMRWNAYLHRLDLGLYSHLKEVFGGVFFGGGRGGGVESELMLTMLTPRGKSTLPENFSSEEARTDDVASSRTSSPTHYQRANPTPLQQLHLSKQTVPEKH